MFGQISPVTLTDNPAKLIFSLTNLSEYKRVDKNKNRFKMLAQFKLQSFRLELMVYPSSGLYDQIQFSLKLLLSTVLFIT